MQPNEPNDKDNNPRQINNYVKYSGVAFQMIAIIGIFAYAGYELDAWLKNEVQWITALSCLIGVCLSIFLVIKQLNK